MEGNDHAKPQVLELKDGDWDRLEKILKRGLPGGGKHGGLSPLLLKAKGETVNAIAEKVGGVYTISVDELTGIVALGLPSPDLIPTGA